MKKGILLIVALFSLLSFTKATHLVGGDINIKWVSQNNYEIKLRYYRDVVNGWVNMPTQMTVRVYDQVTHLQVAQQILTRTSIGIVPLGDPCYTPDPLVVSIEEGVFESPASIVLADNPNGYYVSAHEGARNALAINVQAGGNMTWFAMISDPAMGQNSTPDFGDYPNDAYFCITGPKQWKYPITDADGDSLAYKFTQPLAGNGAGAGAYPFYPGLNWAVGYSLTNIVGGATNMNINPTTGLITAWPTALGFFTFAITVEEFRDTTAAQNGPKVKIGESRRDVQYISLNCTSGSPPAFLNTFPTMNQTIQIPYNYEYCKDLIFADLNVTDSVYFEMSSSIFDSGAYQPTMTPDLNGDYTFYYNWVGSAWADSVVIPPNQYDPAQQDTFNIGTVAGRFCWTPDCDDIDGIFPFVVTAYSLGCDGKASDSIFFNLQVVPPPTELPHRL